MMNEDGDGRWCAFKPEDCCMEEDCPSAGTQYHCTADPNDLTAECLNVCPPSGRNICAIEESCRTIHPEWFQNPYTSATPCHYTCHDCNEPCGASSSCVAFSSLSPLPKLSVGPESKDAVSPSTSSATLADEDIANIPHPATYPYSHPFSTNSLYCHWGEDCESSFNSPLALDKHLRNDHLSSTADGKTTSSRTTVLQPQPRQQENPWTLGPTLPEVQQRQQKRPQPQRQQQPPPTIPLMESEDLNDMADLNCRWASCNASLQEFEELLSHVRTKHMVRARHDAHPSALREEAFQSIPRIPPLPPSPHVYNSNNNNNDNNSKSSSNSNNNNNHFACGWIGCNESFNDPRSLDLHVLLYHMQTYKPLQCEWDACNYQANSSDKLLNHVHKKHVEPSAQSAIQVETTHEDPIPSASSEHHKCLWVNEEGEVCNRCFPSTQTLSEHVIEAHVGSRKNEYVCQWFGCERERKPFQQRQKLTRHLQTHTKNKPFKCEICGYRFAEQSILVQHMRTHSGEKPYECKVCGKRFAAGTALSVHMRTHTGEKPLRCKWPGCTKSFSESSNLTKHLKTHLNGKILSCPIPGCNKVFHRREQLQRHMRIHKEQQQSQHHRPLPPGAANKDSHENLPADWGHIPVG